MRVVHVITRLIVGGAQENTLDSVAGLRRVPGYDVRLVSGPTEGAEGSLVPNCLAQGVPLEVVPDLVRPIHPGRDVRAARQLERLFREWRPQVVHTHSGKAGVLGRWAARRAAVPWVVHTVHGPSFGPFQGRLANTLLGAAERRAAAWTDHFVAVCDAMIEQYVAAGVAPRERFSRIWSGFDVSAFAGARNDPNLRAHWRLAEDDVVVGCLARLAPLKGHEDLARLAPELIAACPKVKLLLIGDGPWRQRLGDLYARRGLQDHVRWVGLIGPETVPAFMGILDVLVHLSRREGLARALPQALAAGRPVVSYDCDGAREICREGETGFLVAAGDAAAAGRRLLELCRDPHLRETLGRRGRAWVWERFTVERMVDDLRNLYETLARRGRGTS